MKRTMTCGWPITDSPAAIQPSTKSGPPVQPRNAGAGGVQRVNSGICCHCCQAAPKPPSSRTATTSSIAMATIMTMDWAASVQIEARMPPAKQ